MRNRCAPFSLLLASLAIAAPTNAEPARQFTKLDASQADATRIEWQARAEMEPREARLAPRFHDQDFCILPNVLVDTLNPSGETTLFGLINQTPPFQEGVDTSFFVDIYDVFHDTLYTDEIMVPPGAAFTTNIRDVVNPGDADFDGFVRGFGSIEGPGLSCDTYQVSPGDNFAIGDVMFNPDDRCFEADARYGIGGPFDDSFYLFLLDSLPVDPDEFEVLMTVHTEDGTFVDGALFSLIPTDAFVEQGSLSALFADFGIVAPPFGYVIISYSPGTNGGYFAIRLNAESRYSVGLPGTCRVSAIPPPVQ